MNNVNKFVKIVLLIIAGLFITILFCKFVPYNMDEFSSYQVIICAHYKNAHLNTFRESCGRSDLNVLNTGLFLPLREYEYIGSITSLYYYPVFLMWKSPVSARFMGIIFLLIQAIILSKIFKIKIEYIFLGLVAFFPYFFQHIVDTGVVGFQITLTYAAYYFLTRWFEKINLKYILIVSLLLFLGIWAKLTFVFFLPGLSLIFLQLLIKNRKSIFYDGEILCSNQAI